MQGGCSAEEVCWRAVGGFVALIARPGATSSCASRLRSDTLLQGPGAQTPIAITGFTAHTCCSRRAPAAVGGCWASAHRRADPWHALPRLAPSPTWFASGPSMQHPSRRSSSCCSFDLHSRSMAQRACGAHAPGVGGIRQQQEVWLQQQPCASLTGSARHGHRRAQASHGAIAPAIERPPRAAGSRLT